MLEDPWENPVLLKLHGETLVDGNLKEAIEAWIQLDASGRRSAEGRAPFAIPLPIGGEARELHHAEFHALSRAYRAQFG